MGISEAEVPESLSSLIALLRCLSGVQIAAAAESRMASIKRKDIRF
jgi:hypothetical protein